MNLLFLAQTSSDTAANGAAVGFAGFGIFFILLAVLTSVFWIWMLIDCLTNAALRGAEKIVWLLVILFLHVLGAVIYFFIGRGTRQSV